VSITLSFENGAVASIVASDTATAPWSYEATSGENPHYFHADENCYYFLGTMGSLAFPQMELWSYTDENRRGWQHPMRDFRHKVAPADPLVLQLAHFCRVIRGEDRRTRWNPISCPRARRAGVYSTSNPDCAFRDLAWSNVAWA